MKKCVAVLLIMVAFCIVQISATSLALVPPNDNETDNSEDIYYSEDGDDDYKEGIDYIKGIDDDDEEIDDTETDPGFAVRDKRQRGCQWTKCQKRDQADYCHAETIQKDINYKKCGKSKKVKAYCCPKKKSG